MKIITNEKLIRRNTRIGVTATVGSIVILAGGFYLSVTWSSQDPRAISVMWGALLLGFLLSQVGIYFGNRWGRRPRPDELLDTALKGMDNRYSIYHYASPIAHLLVGPVGVWVLEAYTQAGQIVYEKNRWRQKGGNLGQKYMRLFAQEGLGRPDLEVDADVEKIKKHLQAKLPDVELPSIQSVLVFINPKAELGDLDDAPLPALTTKELKEYLRKSSKGNTLAAEMIKQINEALDSC